MNKVEARAKARQGNCLFAEKITGAQWNVLKLLSVADRQRGVLGGKQYAMCLRLQSKGLVKLSPAGFKSTRFEVQLTDAGSAMVAREWDNG